MNKENIKSMRRLQKWLKKKKTKEKQFTSVNPVILGTIQED